MTIHKDIHFKYDYVIDNAAESSFTVRIARDNALIQFCAVAEQTLIFGIFSKWQLFCYYKVILL